MNNQKVIGYKNKKEALVSVNFDKFIVPAIRKRYPYMGKLPRWALWSKFKRMLRRLKIKRGLLELDEIMSVQPMGAPTKIKFKYVRFEDLPEGEQLAKKQNDENIRKAFEAIEVDRKEHGTRYDVMIDITCPNCDGELRYFVSSWNGHRRCRCNGTCKVNVIE